jgi:hypothetical protein
MSNSQPQSARGAGAIIALSSITGVIAGGLMGQPSIGLLAGVGTGMAIGLLMWWYDRRK